MVIKFVEIQNFRKLKSCRIEFSENKTVFVGANNSGKTSAIDALIIFLKNKSKTFTVNDITLSNWDEIQIIGKTWENEITNDELSINRWNKLMPALDIWINVNEDEVHRVTHLIPSLEWNSGLLGVRLVLEPKNVELFYKDFHDAYTNAICILSSAKSTDTGKKTCLKLWPANMRDFLSRRLTDYFEIKPYILDPSKLIIPTNGIANPQELPIDSEPILSNPFDGLFCIHNIDAQRGFSGTNVSSDNDAVYSKRTGSILSSQLRNYYDKHINPEAKPNINDIKALEAKSTAEEYFDIRLKEGLSRAITELETIGYPGFANPTITISANINTSDTIMHESAVQFDVVKGNEEMPKLPEKYNGLGYQNLISMVFNLMDFRDDWMLEGKSTKEPSRADGNMHIAPLHIVFIEEPEAHLHAQVQQVFIRKAYEILMNHTKLRKKNSLSTQLIVSTHSSNIAHAVEFNELRYFKRKPIDEVDIVPISTVVNLSEVFGTDLDTEKFTIRYLKSTHCDLFFADAAILVEGAAERILLPHFIEKEHPKLNESYISVLEIGGSHAHRIKPLIEKLGLITLIITDLDSVDPKEKNTSAPPVRLKGLTTYNSTIKACIKGVILIDDLISLSDDRKLCSNAKYIRIAYQKPIMLGKEEAISNTLEDSLVFCNLDKFKDMVPEGLLMKKICENVKAHTSTAALGIDLFDALKKYGSKKAEFALELLFNMDAQDLNVPKYISEGLSWLCDELQKKQPEIIETKINDKIDNGVV